MLWVRREGGVVKVGGRFPEALGGFSKREVLILVRPDQV